MQETEKREQEELDAKEEYEKKQAFLTIAFVEHLDGDYLFYQMFEDDIGSQIDLIIIFRNTQ